MNRLRRIVWLALKDLRILLRDRAGLFWLLGFPVLFAVFFGMAFSGNGGTRGLRVGIADEDESELSKKTAEYFAANDAVTTMSVTRSAAQDGLRQGRLSAAIVMHRGYGKTLTGFLDNDPGGTHPLELLTDASHQMEAGYAQGMLLQARFQALEDVLLQPDSMRKLIARGRDDLSHAAGLSPVAKQMYATLLNGGELYANSEGTSSARGNLSSPFGKQNLQQMFSLETSHVSAKSSGPGRYVLVALPQAMLWGMIGCIAGFAVSLVQERTRGTLARIRISPVAPWELLASKALGCFVASNVVLIALAIIGRIVFKVHVQNFALFGIAILTLTTCFIGLMVFTSTLGSTEQAVAGSGWAMFLVFSMIGGGMIPLFIMPGWMQSMSNISPVKWGLLLLEGVYWRQFSLREMLRPCAVLLAFGGAAFWLGLVNMRRMR